MGGLTAGIVALPLALAFGVSSGLGYNAKEDAAYVEQFVPFAEEQLLEKILIEESKEGLLVLEDFEETIDRAHKITPEQIALEAQFMAGKSASWSSGEFAVVRPCTA